jgi:hypothetical protein
MQITIEVIQDDIETGVGGSSDCCAIAKAIRRTLPNMNEIEVEVDSVRFRKTWGSGEWQQLELPPSAQEFIEKFDQGHITTPFQFSLGKNKPKQGSKHRSDTGYRLPYKGPNNKRQHNRKPQPLRDQS